VIAMAKSLPRATVGWGCAGVYVRPRTRKRHGGTGPTNAGDGGCGHLPRRLASADCSAGDHGAISSRRSIHSPGPWAVLRPSRG
jgi:hypothetical protein